jgi:predicted dehydrogenase
MAMKRRVVVVGLGSIGRRHTRLLQERSDIEVEIVEPSQQARSLAHQEIHGLRLHASYEEMLETQPDIVWLATPTPLHATHAISALDAGCHVFCEKPMSSSLESAKRMKAAAEQADRVLNIGFMWHFSSAFIALRTLICDGELGAILHAHARVGTYITLVNSGSHYQICEPGSLFWDYSHQPDLFYWLLGKKPSSVHVTAFQAGDLELTSNPNVAIVVCRYEDRMVTTTHLNYVQMPQCHDYEIVGDRGWAQVRFPSATLTIGLRDKEGIRSQSYAIEADEMYRAEQVAFLEATDGKRMPETSPTDGLISTAIAEACVESWKRDQAVAVGWP